MKPNTVVFVSIRNVGDANDEGQIFEGKLKESIVWLATQLATRSMKTKFVIGIGRNQEDAISVIQPNRVSKNKVSNDVKSMLDSLFAETQSDQAESGLAPSHTIIEPRDPRDTYEG